MVPNLTDIKELFRVMKYFIFITNERPSLVYHGLKESSAIWLCSGAFRLSDFQVIPVVQGILHPVFSGNVLNFAYIAHSDEAFLASIVIFIWHLYNVHLAPAVFPMGAAWLNGSIDEREMVEYHYEDYIRSMKDAGLQERIRPNALDRAYKTSFLARSVGIYSWVFI